ncbi:MAG: translation initiation factor IF-2 [Rhodospirillaceae bacterium]
MPNSNDQDRKKLSLSGRGKLSLSKTVETSQVRQSFSHGRSKTVQVEVRRPTRVKKPVVLGAKEAPKAPEPVAETVQPEVAAPEAVTTEDKSVTNLTEVERAARERALQQGMKHDDDAAVSSDSDVPAVAELESAVVAPPEEPAVPLTRREAELQEARAIADAEAAAAKAESDRLVEEEAARQARAAAERASQKLEEEAAAAKASAARPVTEPREAGGPAATTDDDSNPRNRRRLTADAPGRKQPAARRGEQRRRSSKLTISEALSDESERVRSLAAMRRAREREKARLQDSSSENLKQVRDVIIPDSITVQELSNRMAARGADLIKSLMKMGFMATINQVIDGDTAELLVQEFGHTPKRVSEADVEIGLAGETDAAELLKPRPPVVTVMGHVDHGKTSLLDALRRTSVVSGEAGGITQHIGAYQVTLQSGQKITFLDTPGHAAFTEMRSRGATVTDLVILVVAGDDGIKEQTVEAIRHAKAAQVPVIVAINKMDKPEADAQRVRNELLQHEIIVEEVGGDVMAVEVSATQGSGLDALEEAILLQAEVMELTANPDRVANGTVIEAKMERGRGSVATVLIQRGTLNVGDVFVAGAEWGKVRALIDDRGQNCQQAGPSFPVEVLGLGGTPVAGDDFVVVDSEARAREIVDYRQRVLREKQATAGARGTVEQMLTKIATGEAREVPVVIKADVHGSLEAIRSTLDKLVNDQVAMRVLHGAVGGINESDVTLAQASGAIVIGFNVRANPQARELARRESIDIRYYSIIYNLIDDMKVVLTGLMAPDLKEEFLGNAEIKETFNITKVGKIAGCLVTNGSIRRGAKVRLLRDNVVIHEGTLKTLKRFKDEVKDVREGYECGAAFEGYNDLQVGDVIECFDVKEVVRDFEASDQSLAAS